MKGSTKKFTEEDQWNLWAYIVASSQALEEQLVDQYQI